MSRAEYRRDAADQVEEWNAGWRDEVASQRHADWVDIYDDQPTRAELEAEEGWLIQLDAQRPDPWNLPPVTPRAYPPTPTDPPF